MVGGGVPGWEPHPLTVWSWGNESENVDYEADKVNGIGAVNPGSALLVEKPKRLAY